MTGVTPSDGFIDGGEQVVVTGFGFTGATAVEFVDGACAGDGHSVSVPASQFVSSSDTRIAVVAPDDSANASSSCGPQGLPTDVEVVVPAGTTPVVASDAFVEAIPDVSGVSPGSGPGDGGTSVTLQGSGFEGGGSSSANVVTFTDGCGDIASATSVHVVNDSTVTATAPGAVADFQDCGGSDSLPVNVTVGVPDPGNPGQEITSQDQESDVFAYTVSPPTITSAAATDFTVGTAGTFTVTTDPGVDSAGDGLVTLSAPANELPAGVTFADQGNGTAAIAGTPSAGTSGVYDVTITASNGVAPDATQTFVLTVLDVPSAPLGASAAPGVGSASVTWSPPASDGESTITSYTVTASPGGANASADGSAGQATVGGLTPGGQYSFTVTATNAIGTSAASAPSNTVTIDVAPTSITVNGPSSVIVGDRLLGHVDGGRQPEPEPDLLVRAGRAELALRERQHRRRERDVGARGAGLHLQGRGLQSGGFGDQPPGGSDGVAREHGAQHHPGPAPDGPGRDPRDLHRKGDQDLGLGTTLGPDDLHVRRVGSGCSNLPVSGGKAQCTVTFGSTGSFKVKASYSGDPYFTSSTDFVTQNVGSAGAPTITSPASATATAGTSFTFGVTTSGTTTPTLTETGALPTGLGFVDNGDGTATMSGTPAATSGGVYDLTITAKNSGGTTKQNFVLTVDQAPVFTSPASATATIGTVFSFKVKTSGFPAATLSENGANCPLG